MYYDNEIRKSVEREKQRIIGILKENGITQSFTGERLEDMYLLPLTLMKNSLLPDID